MEIKQEQKKEMFEKYFGICCGNSWIIEKCDSKLTIFIFEKLIDFDDVLSLIFSLDFLAWIARNREEKKIFLKGYL